MSVLSVVAAALSGLAGGTAGAIITARAKLRELETQADIAQRERTLEEHAKHQLQYLNPLRVVALDLHERISELRDRTARKDTFLQDTLEELPLHAAKPPHEFASWANDMGQYALSTLYLGLAYFARASLIRTELPYVRLSSDDDAELLGHLTRVRHAFGGPLGIWESLQDSLGSYVLDDGGRIISYHAFCRQLTDETMAPWYHRAVEFFRDFHRKTPDEHQQMLSSLSDLIDFLERKPHETRMDRATVSAEGRKDPEEGVLIC